MPKGPQGQKRPADVIGNAVKVMRIATGEEPDDADKSTSRQREGGKKGGINRAARLTPLERQEIAREAAAKRWGRRG